MRTESTTSELGVNIVKLLVGLGKTVCCGSSVKQVTNTQTGTIANLAQKSGNLVMSQMFILFGGILFFLCQKNLFKQ